MNTYSRRIDFKIIQEPYLNRKLSLYIYQIENTPDAQIISIADGISLRRLTQDDEACLQRPSCTLLQDEAQQLMDELWRVGIRPTEGHGSTGQLAAIERHLADLQKLVFTKASPASLPSSPASPPHTP